MRTREEVLNDVKLLAEIRVEQIGTGDQLLALRRVLEYVQQDPDPDPDAALWVEIEELLTVLNDDPEDFWNLLRSVRSTPVRWQVVTRKGGSAAWSDVGQPWAGLPLIRDQLRTLATKRGLCSPSLDEMAAIINRVPDGCRWTLCSEQVVQLKAFLAALAAKEGE